MLANGKVLRTLATQRPKELWETTAGKATTMSPNAGTTVIKTTKKYTTPSRLKSGDETDKRIRTIANGYKNISIGVDQAMIWSSPKLAVRKEAKQERANQAW